MNLRAGRLPLTLCAAAFSLTLSACAPQAVFFHESTKVGVSATYNVADSQPVSSHFGFKRRIAAVVPGQERLPDAQGQENNATNRGEALSLVSKFDVSVGNLKEGMVIRNNFATGRAAQVLTARPDAAEATKALLQNGTVVVPASIDATQTRTSFREDAAADAAAAEVARSSTTRPPRTTTRNTTPIASATPTPAAAATPAPTEPPVVIATPTPIAAVTKPTPPPARREVDRSGKMTTLSPADADTEPTPEPR